jgi:hypothetical protein
MSYSTDSDAHNQYKARKREYAKNRRATKQMKTPHGSNKKSKFETAQFVVWDGEGYNLIKDDPTSHVYWLLCYVESRTGEKGCIEADIGKHLTTNEILKFITTISIKFPHAIHTAFVHSYDVEKWLCDLSEDERELVKRTASSQRYKAPYREYTICYRPRKEFCLSYPKRDKNGRVIYKTDKKTGRDKIVRRSVTIWDIFGFFQEAQTKAIEHWLGKDHSLLKQIAAMKSQRADFIVEQRDEIKDYCYAELHALIELVTKVHEYAKRMGITLTRWDGAGAVAGALMKKNQIKTENDTLPKEVEDAARHGYFGGRIELLKFGHYEGTVHHYDINSAYPSHMRNLPSLKGGEWKHFTGDNMPESFDSELVIFHVKWNDDVSPYAYKTIYPFPYRTKQNMVYYPAMGEGWYWKPEIDMAIHYFNDMIEVIECYAFSPANDKRPFSFINELFQLRREMVRNGDGAEKMVKLGLNSLYGKCAQKIGAYDKNDMPTAPAYHNLAYAGYITSATRSQLLMAALQKPESIIMFQTDGIASLEPLDVAISETKELGKWEHDTFNKLTAVQSGVYWHDKPDKPDEIYGYIRGFDKIDHKTGLPTLSEEMVLNGWKNNFSLLWKEKKIQNEGNFGKLPAKMTRFLTWRGVAHSKELKKIVGTFHTMNKDLQLGPGTTTKRQLHTKYEDSIKKTFPKPWETLIDTNAAIPMVLKTGIVMSYPYTRPWDNDFSFLLDIDGTSLSIAEQEHTVMYLIVNSF